MEGESLRARLGRDGALPIRDVVGILRDVARGLAYAHGHDVVHRDIKPDNVLLSRGSAAVANFGVAKALSSARHPTPGGTLTTVGSSLGTPTYMALEQAAADPSTDHRADLYAVGVMAYELLTGLPPFHGRSPRALLTAQLTEHPAPVTDRRPDTPPALAALVMRCLEKDPALRPQSADEVVATLDGVGTPSAPHAAVHTSGAVPTVAVRRRRPRALVFGASALGALALVALAARFLLKPSATAGDGDGLRSIAVLPLALDPRSATAHQWYAELLFITGRMKDAARELRQAHALDPLSPVIAAEGSYILALAGEREDAYAMGRRAIELAPDLWFGHGFLGAAYLFGDRPDAAIPELERTVQLDSNVTMFIGVLAYAYGRYSRATDARRLLSALERHAAEGRASPFGVAIGYAGLDDTTRALDWLERAHRERDPFLYATALSPNWFDRLRGEPRFREVARKMGLDVELMGTTGRQ